MMMKALLVALFAVLTVATPTRAAAQSVTMHVGWVDLNAIISGEKALPLSEPTVALKPAFDDDIKSYTVRMPHGVDGVTVVVETSPMYKAGVIDFNGVQGGVQAVTYEKAFGSTKGNVVTFRLQPGDNRLRLGFKFIDLDVYEFVITRPESPSSDKTLAALKVGNGELRPAFDPDARTYRTRIVGNALTVTPIPSAGSVTVTGTAADGGALRVDGNSVSGLTAGDNTAVIAVTAEDGSSATYTLIAEVSDDIRKVAKGDTISRQSDCDSDIGCDGTLNGVQGRFACGGVDWRSESTNMRISVSGMCLLSTSGGVVTNIAGWYFAAFP